MLVHILVAGRLLWQLISRASTSWGFLSVVVLSRYAPRFAGNYSGAGLAFNPSRHSPAHCSCVAAALFSPKNQVSQCRADFIHSFRRDHYILTMGAPRLDSAILRPLLSALGASSDASVRLLEVAAVAKDAFLPASSVASTMFDVNHETRSRGCADPGDAKKFRGLIQSRPLACLISARTHLIFVPHFTRRDLIFFTVPFCCLHERPAEAWGRSRKLRFAFCFRSCAAR